MDNETLTNDRDYLNKRMGQMVFEASTFIDHWRKLSEFFEPRRGRFDVHDVNRGERRYKSIINNHATKALRRATAGLFAGTMSPSRPWFTFDMMDRDLMKRPDVKEWLTLFRWIILRVFAKSNLYNMAPLMLRELLGFGGGGMTHVDDFDDVSRFYTHTIGSYYISLDSRGNVNSILRVSMMTVYQIVQKFGINNVSVGVRNNYNSKNFNQRHKVAHIIELNPFRDIEKARLSSEFQMFRSVYWETNSSGVDKMKYLERKGFRGFPAYCPRWEVTGEDIYATSCPGMICLGDTMQLQSQEQEQGKAIAKHSTPPLQGPPSIRNTPVANLPGGMTVVSGVAGQKIEPMYQVTPQTNEMMMDIERTERRIDEMFYVDLFMAITDIQGIQPKNQFQLSQVNEERLLQLGPVLEQIHGEWLDRMVTRTGQQVLEAGIMPPAPKELQDRILEIDFVSALAMAQKAVGVNAIERTTGFAKMMMESGWDVSDKIDPDFAIDEYASLLGAPPKLIIPSEQAKQAREQRARDAARAQQMEMAGTAAKAAKDVGSIPMGEDNVLSRTVS